MARGVAAICAAAVAVLGGCSATQSAGGGPITITTGLPGGPPTQYQLVPAAVAAPPPPALPGGLPPSGRYRGEMVSVNNPGGRCTPRVPVNNWTVQGARVRFGGFRGTIEPTGVLNMQQRGAWVSGQFRGSQFVGEFWSPGLSCDYTMVLEHVG